MDFYDKNGDVVYRLDGTERDPYEDGPDFPEDISTTYTEDGSAVQMLDDGNGIELSTFVGDQHEVDVQGLQRHLPDREDIIFTVDQLHNPYLPSPGGSVTLHAYIPEGSVTGQFVIDAVSALPGRLRDILNREGSTSVWDGKE